MGKRFAIVIGVAAAGVMATVALTLAVVVPASAFTPKKGKWVGKTAQGEPVSFTVNNKVTGPCPGPIIPPTICEEKTKFLVVTSGSFAADCPIPSEWAFEWGFITLNKPDNKGDEGAAAGRGFYVTSSVVNDEIEGYPDETFIDREGNERVQTYIADTERSVFGKFKTKRKAKGRFEFTNDYGPTKTVDGRPLTDCHVDTKWKAKRK